MHHMKVKVSDRHKHEVCIVLDTGQQHDGSHIATKVAHVSTDECKKHVSVPGFLLPDMQTQPARSTHERMLHPSFAGECSDQ